MGTGYSDRLKPVSADRVLGASDLWEDEDDE
jgi:hypothetical protein